MNINTTFSEEVINEMNLLDEFLSITENILVNPFVAGGAPRDWFFNQVSTDIDIFVDTTTDMVALKKLIEEDSQLKFIREVNKDSTILRDYSTAELFDVLTLQYTYLDSIPKTIQVISSNLTGNELLKTFPVGLSCISYSNYLIKPTKLFINSVRHARLFHPADIETRKFRAYFDKISGKFHRYSFARLSREEYDSGII